MSTVSTCRGIPVQEPPPPYCSFMTRSHIISVKLLLVKVLNHYIRIHSLCELPTCCCSNVSYVGVTHRASVTTAAVFHTMSLMRMDRYGDEVENRQSYP